MTNLDKNEAKKNFFEKKNQNGWFLQNLGKKAVRTKGQFISKGREDSPKKQTNEFAFFI